MTDDREIIALITDAATLEKGFRLLVEQYSRPLYSQIRRMVLFHDDADDILQETFISAWKNIGYFRAEARLSTWLYRIALNQCLTFLNKQKAERRVSIDNPDVSDVLEQLLADAYFDGDEAQCRLQEAVLTLPDKQRMVFNMRYYDKMSYEDMSDIFGTTVSALKSDYHHAVKKIEKKISQSD